VPVAADSSTLKSPRAPWARPPQNGKDEQEREVLVLRRDGTGTLLESSAEPLVQFMRGTITMHRQSAGKLAEVVVDATGLNGSQMLRDGLKKKYDLVVTPAKRRVRMPVMGNSD
jgi:hypothetical protein